MQLFKRILLGLAALTIVSIFALIIYFWPIDSRLSGTFKSNKDATISYLQATRKLTDRQRHVFDQMYGHLSYKFDGHRLKTIMEPHVVRGYGREDLYIEKEITEFYFFVKKSDKNSATIVVLPGISPI